MLAFVRHRMGIDSFQHLGVDSDDERTSTDFASKLSLFMSLNTYAEIKAYVQKHADKGEN
jgi:hypothetical protein